WRHLAVWRDEMVFTRISRRREARVVGCRDALCACVVRPRRGTGRLQTRAFAWWVEPRGWWCRRALAGRRGGRAGCGRSGRREDRRCRWWRGRRGSARRPRCDRCEGCALLLRPLGRRGGCRPWLLRDVHGAVEQLVTRIRV